MSGWVLPHVGNWLSLWEPLHDAYVLSIEHDALERVALVELKLGYPDIAAKSRVTSELATLRFSGTSRIFLSLWRSWPGPKREHRQGQDNEEWNRDADEWIKKGHLQTVSHAEFNQALSQDRAYILEARGSFQSDLSVIEFDGCFNKGESFHARIAGDALSVLMSDRVTNIEELMLHGERAWIAFNSS